MTNDTCLKSSMSPQYYKFVSTHDHEISGCTIISRLLHSRAPHLEGINGYFRSNLAILTFNNGEQLEDFHIRILILQQKIIFYGETVSPKIVLFRYMKVLSNDGKLKSFIGPKIADLIIFLDNNGKSALYKEGNVHGLYCYLEMIGVPITLTA